MTEPIYCMVHDVLTEVDNYTDSQEISSESSVLCAQNPATGTHLSQRNLIHTFTSCSSVITLNVKKGKAIAVTGRGGP
jgi:hypothetical protein